MKWDIKETVVKVRKKHITSKINLTETQRQFIRTNYLENLASPEAIGKALGISQPMVLKFLHKDGTYTPRCLRRSILINAGKIKVPYKGEKQSKEVVEKRAAHIRMLHREGKLKSWNDHNFNHSEVIELFNSGKNIVEIAKEFNCNSKAIGRILSKHNIKTQYIWNKYGQIIKDLYINQYKSSKEIASILNLNHSSVMYALKKYAVPMRTGPYPGRFALEKNPRWLGGKSFEPYTEYFNKNFKNTIRSRDNQVCMNCGIHREKLKEALHIHHINYDKKCTIEQNCISLCRKCHMLTNINREYWTKIFQDKIAKLYGYKYSSDGITIINLNSGEKQNAI